MSDPLKIASLATWVPGIAYVLAVAIVGFFISYRSLPPTPVATRDLGRNHLVVPGDLETSTIAPLLGQYLQKGVKRGETVTGGMVAAKPLPARIASTMAAVIAMPVATYKAQKIDVGRDVQICVKASAFGAASKVLAVDCDEQVCSVLVGLPKVATQTVDPDALADARLVTGVQTCSGPPP
jgi:hypothetical protein